MILHPSDMNSGDLYAMMIRSVLPRPIAWVSSKSVSGVLNLAPFSFFTAISVDPPTLCFALGRRSKGAEKKDTLVNIEGTGEFVVNVVNEKMAEAMNATAGELPPESDEFAEVGLTPASCERISVPRVAESPVSFECERYDVINVGDPAAGGGSLVIGKIIAIHVHESVVRDGKIDPELLRPIGRLGGMEYTRLGERFTMGRG